MESPFITLESLVGNHILSAVDIDATHPDKHANAIRFKLGDVTYLAVEDSDDGYRSSMDHIAITQDECPRAKCFRGVEVVARMSSEYGQDVLHLIHAKTGRIIVEVGTDGGDCYYPCWIARFNPEDVL